MIYPQLLLGASLLGEIIVDLFAGGGGASYGIEWALGRQVDVAINHDRDAVAMHEANHPQTEHYESGVFEVDPWEVVRKQFRIPVELLRSMVGRLVGLLWLSPDCTYYSKSRGGKPIRHAHRKRRALAWIALRWAGTVRPRVIVLENVEEFQGWGPLVAKRCPKTGRVVKLVEDGADKKGDPKYREEVSAPGEHVPVQDQALVPDPRRAGETFRTFVRQLRELGYAVEWRELEAQDYGAATRRKRLFMIARCDGRAIVWPEPSRCTAEEFDARARRSVEWGAEAVPVEPVDTTANHIDWRIPMLSVLATREDAIEWAAARREEGWAIRAPRRPLADASCRRIARGVVKYVIENEAPYVVPEGAAAFLRRDFGQSTGQPLDEPGPTTTAGGGGHSALVAAWLAQHNSDRTPKAGRPLDAPCSTLTTSGSHQQLLAASLVQSGYGERPGQAPRVLDIEAPAGTLVGSNKYALVTAHLSHAYGSNTNGGDGAIDAPHKTLTTGSHHSLVTAFLSKFYGTGVARPVDEPADTITTRDRFGLVTVAGRAYAIEDIATRMLWPRELYGIQGFPPDYVIDRGADGEPLTREAQVRMVGNSVPPPFARAIVAVNCADLRVTRSRGEVRAARQLAPAGVAA